LTPDLLECAVSCEDYLLSSPWCPAKGGGEEAARLHDSAEVEGPTAESVQSEFFRDEALLPWERGALGVWMCMHACVCMLWMIFVLEKSLT